CRRSAKYRGGFAALSRSTARRQVPAELTFLAVTFPRAPAARPLRCVSCTMIRVTRMAADDGNGTLRVEGRLTHETVEELRMACEALLTEQGSLHLDVSGLRFVDPAGVTLLHGLEARGTRLDGRSGFITELLRDRERAPSADAALVEQLRAGDREA